MATISQLVGKTYHQQQDLQHHCGGTAQPATERPLEGTFEVKLRAWSATYPHYEVNI